MLQFFFSRTLTQNIRLRRTEKVDIRVPLFIDTHTHLQPAPPLPLGLDFELSEEAQEIQSSFSHRALCDSCIQAAKTAAEAKLAAARAKVVAGAASGASASGASASGADADAKEDQAPVPVSD